MSVVRKEITRFPRFARDIQYKYERDNGGRENEILTARNFNAQNDDLDSHVHERAHKNLASSYQSTISIVARYDFPSNRPRFWPVNVIRARDSYSEITLTEQG